MRVDKAEVDKAQDPTWYQAAYAFAAANLNSAVAAWVVSRYVGNPADAVRREAMTDLWDYLHNYPAPPDGVAGLNAAAHAARDLVETTIKTLRDSGSGTRRRPRFVLTQTRRRRLRKRRMREFLESQVYATSLTLLCGVLQFRDVVYGAPPEGSSSAPPVRGPDKSASPASLPGHKIDRTRLLLELRSSSGPDHAAIARSIAAGKDLDARVRYNLACYWSRALEYDDALEQLRAAMHDAAPGVLKLIYLQALSDPALVPLRTERREQFAVLLKRYAPPVPSKTTKPKKGDAAKSETERAAEQATKLQEEQEKKAPDNFELMPSYLDKLWPGSGIQFVARGLQLAGVLGADVRDLLRSSPEARTQWRTVWRGLGGAGIPLDDPTRLEKLAQLEEEAERLLDRLLMLPAALETLPPAPPRAPVS